MQSPVSRPRKQKILKDLGPAVHWHSERHVQERRTYLQKPPSKNPLLFRQVPGCTRSTCAPSCELWRSLANSGELWRTHNAMFTRTSATFTRVLAKVPHIHQSSGEGAFCMWVAFRMCPIFWLLKLTQKNGFGIICVITLSTSDFQSEVGEVFGDIGGELPAKFGRRFSSFFCWENRQKHFPPKLHCKFHHQTSLRGSGLWRALTLLISREQG